MTENLIQTIHAALENEPAVNLHKNPVRIDVRDGIATLEGNVDSIVPKRLAPRLAMGVPGIKGVLDHIRVVPGERRGDGALRDGVYQMLVQEPVFTGCTIKTVESAQIKEMPPPEEGKEIRPGGGEIHIAVEDGVVTLVGHVQSLSHKRLADVLAWWAPGSVDVRNRLHVVPPQQDHDEEITDSLRIVLEKDPSLDATQILVRTWDRKVMLRGLVRSAEQRAIAERDAWLVLGVHQVDNQIEVKA